MGAPVNNRVVIIKPRFTQNYVMFIFRWSLEDSNVTKDTSRKVNIGQAFVDLSIGSVVSIKPRNLHQFFDMTRFNNPGLTTSQVAPESSSVCAVGPSHVPVLMIKSSTGSWSESSSLMWVPTSWKILETSSLSDSTLSKKSTASRS